MLIIPPILIATGYIYYYIAGMSPDSASSYRLSNVGSAFIWMGVGSLIAL